MISLEVQTSQVFGDGKHGSTAEVKLEVHEKRKKQSAVDEKWLPQNSADFNLVRKGALPLFLPAFPIIHQLACSIWLVFQCFVFACVP